MRLVAQGLAVNRGERAIFQNLSFCLGEGQALVVTGPNGSGKSTLLKAIAGILRPASGAITLEGCGEGGAQEHCHYLAHDNALKPVLTVRENLEFWQRFLGPGREIGEALAEIGLPQVADIPAGYLSAGQKRRVAIARLLATRRPVWLLDEPTAALDDVSQRRFGEIVGEFMATGGIVIAATHQSLGIAGHRSLDLAAGGAMPA